MSQIPATRAAAIMEVHWNKKKKKMAVEEHRYLKSRLSSQEKLALKSLPQVPLKNKCLYSRIMVHGTKIVCSHDKETRGTRSGRMDGTLKHQIFTRESTVSLPFSPPTINL